MSTSPPPPPSPTRPPAPARRGVIAVIVLAPLLASLALWAFAWPSARLAPRDLPIGIAGTARAAAPLEQQLQQRTGAFEVHRYPDADAARTAIEDREVYGAVVVAPGEWQVLTATAAGPVVAQMLQDGFVRSAPPGTEVRTTDVVRAPDADPRGAALGASVLPLALAGVMSGAAVALLGVRGPRAAAGLLGAAAAVGVTAAAIAGSWLEVLPGGWWPEAAALAMTVLAIGSTVAGLAALIGPAGIGVGALLMVLLGNPFSGVTSAPQLLPEPVGVIGQWLPPGAGGSLLRSVAFFDGSASGGPLLVLCLWSAAGLAAVIGSRRGWRTPAGEEREDRILAPVN